MLTGVFGIPIGWFVDGSVAWNVNGVGTPVICVMPQVTPSAPVSDSAMAPLPMFGRPALARVANAVAASPICTERLDGRTAATSGGGGRHSESSRVAKAFIPPSVPAWRQLPVGLRANALTVRWLRLTRC